MYSRTKKISSKDEQIEQYRVADISNKQVNRNKINRLSKRKEVGYIDKGTIQNIDIVSYKRGRREEDVSSHREDVINLRTDKKSSDERVFRSNLSNCSGWSGWAEGNSIQSSTSVVSSIANLRNSAFSCTSRAVNESKEVLSKELTQNNIFPGQINNGESKISGIPDNINLLNEELKAKINLLNKELKNSGSPNALEVINRGSKVMKLIDGLKVCNYESGFPAFIAQKTVQFDKGSLKDLVLGLGCLKVSLESLQEIEGIPDSNVISQLLKPISRISLLIGKSTQYHPDSVLPCDSLIVLNPLKKQLESKIRILRENFHFMKIGTEESSMMLREVSSMLLSLELSLPEIIPGRLKSRLSFVVGTLVSVSERLEIHYATLKDEICIITEIALLISSIIKLEEKMPTDYAAEVQHGESCIELIKLELKSKLIGLSSVLETKNDYNIPYWVEISGCKENKLIHRILSNMIVVTDPVYVYEIIGDKKMIYVRQSNRISYEEKELEENLMLLPLYLESLEVKLRFETEKQLTKELKDVRNMMLKKIKEGHLFANKDGLTSGGWVNPYFGWVNPYFGWVDSSFGYPYFGWVNPYFGWVNPS